MKKNIWRIDYNYWKVSDLQVKILRTRSKEAVHLFFSASQFFIIFVSDAQLFAENITAMVYLSILYCLISQKMKVPKLLLFVFIQTT